MREIDVIVFLTAFLVFCYVYEAVYMTGNCENVKLKIIYPDENYTKIPVIGVVYNVGVEIGNFLAFFGQFLSFGFFGMPLSLRVCILALIYTPLTYITIRIIRGGG